MDHPVPSGLNSQIKSDTSMGGNSVVTDSTTTMNGVVIIDFSKSTTSNFIVLDGVFGGNFGFMRGGSGQDVMTLGLFGDDVDLHIQMGEGDDTLNRAKLEPKKFP